MSFCDDQTEGKLKSANSTERPLSCNFFNSNTQGSITSSMSQSETLYIYQRTPSKNLWFNDFRYNPDSPKSRKELSLVIHPANQIISSAFAGLISSIET